MDQRYRFEHRVRRGPGAANGSTTVIRRGRSVTVDHTDAEGRTRRFRAKLVDGVYERLVGLLRDAGFPEAPRDPLGSGATRIVSAITAGREQRTRPFAELPVATEWASVCASFDAIAAQTTNGLAHPIDPSAEPVVADASEVPLFVPSPEMDEPPLGEDANDVVAEAWKLAIEKKHPEVTAAHLLVAFAREHGYQLARLGIDPERVRTAAEALFTWDPREGEPVATGGFELVPGVARRVAAEDGAHEAGLRHLLRALLEAGGTDVTRILQRQRLPDAMAAGRTRDRIFAVPEPSTEPVCPRCGAPPEGRRWCARCGHALVARASFDTHDPLDSAIPTIEPHDFPERPGTVHKSLCGLPDQAGTPWIAFEIEVDGTRERVTEARLAELGVTLERLEQCAVANLTRVPASWTPRWVPGADGREVDVLFCVDDSLACARILERSFLLHAHDLLGDKALAAAAPQRGMLIATRLGDLAVLMALARHYYDNADSAPLSPWGFVIEAGEIRGPISSA